LGLQLGLTEEHVDTMSTAPGLEASTICADEPAILEEIEVEELAVDGICGVY
jgi:mycofactocin precursor